MNDYDSKYRLFRELLTFSGCNPFGVLKHSMHPAALDSLNSAARSWWYVIHTKPKQEARALLNLTNQGYECFLPMHKKQVVRRAAVVTQAEPLFSRYLFIQLDTNLSGKSWGPIRSTLGLSKLVVFGSEPARVDSGLIHLFKQRELSVADQVTPLFKTGDQVVIAQGPFAGLNATFQMSDGEMRAMVLIEVLNQVSKLKLPLADLRRGA